MVNTNMDKTGVLKWGFVSNLATYLDELKAIAVNVSTNSLRELVDTWANQRIEYLNKYGYTRDKKGRAIDAQNASYIRFKTDCKNGCSEDIYGLYTKVKPNIYKGIEWRTEREIRQIIYTSNLFNMGDLCFEKWNDGQAFLDDMAKCTIPESWKYKNKPSQIHFPILKSYLENTFERLKTETGKLIYSKNEKYVVFNTNLLDKYFHEVLVIAEVRQLCGKEVYHNPFRLKSKKQLVQYGFSTEDTPLPPKYFERVDDVVFHTTWVVDTDFDKFTHIIEERRDRFPEQYKNDSEEQLARKLDDAIKYAIAIAQRNYKFIVPMYRPQKNAIQLLMPIYLSGTYSSQPDFALILTPDVATNMYIPETILPLDAVYQNARLIAKPDESWLNPDIIL